MNFWHLTLLLTGFMWLGACQDNSDTEKNRDHVWKEQTDTLNKARAVEDTLHESAEKQRQQIQEESQ